LKEKNQILNTTNHGLMWPQKTDRDNRSGSHRKAVVIKLSGSQHEFE